MVNSKGNISSGAEFKRRVDTVKFFLAFSPTHNYISHCRARAATELADDGLLTTIFLTEDPPIWQQDVDIFASIVRVPGGSSRYHLQSPVQTAIDYTRYL